MNRETATTVVTVTYVCLCVALVLSLHPSLQYKLKDRLKIWLYNFQMIQWKAQKMHIPSWLNDTTRKDLPEEPSK